METLEEKIKRLSQYLDDEAIARAVDKEVDFVRAVLSGEAVKAKEEKRKDATVIQYVRPAFRQRVVYIARVKGGVGATTLALNMAWRVSEKAKVLLIDAQAELLGFLVCSDVLDLLELEPYEQADWETPEVTQISDNLYFLPYHAKSKQQLERAVLEARRDYDVIIVDLPCVKDGEVLKDATNVVYVYGGGLSEGWRLLQLIRHNQNYFRKDAVYVSIVLRPLIDLRRELEEDNNWIYLPKGKTKNGIFEQKDPAHRAVTEIIREIWGRDLESEKRGFFTRFFQKE